MGSTWAVSLQGRNVVAFQDTREGGRGSYGDAILYTPLLVITTFGYFLSVDCLRGTKESCDVDTNVWITNMPSIVVYGLITNSGGLVIYVLVWKPAGYL